MFSIINLTKHFDFQEWQHVHTYKNNNTTTHVPTLVFTMAVNTFNKATNKDNPASCDMTAEGDASNDYVTQLELDDPLHLPPQIQRKILSAAHILSGGEVTDVHITNNKTKGTPPLHKRTDSGDERRKEMAKEPISSNPNSLRRKMRYTPIADHNTMPSLLDSSPSRRRGIRGLRGRLSLMLHRKNSFKSLVDEEEPPPAAIQHVINTGYASDANPSLPAAVSVSSTPAQSIWAKELSKKSSNSPSSSTAYLYEGSLADDSNAMSSISFSQLDRNDRRCDRCDNNLDCSNIVNTPIKESSKTAETTGTSTTGIFVCLNAALDALSTGVSFCCSPTQSHLKTVNNDAPFYISCSPTSHLKTVNDAPFYISCKTINCKT